MLDLLHERIEDRPLIATDSALIDYVRGSIVGAPVETVRALFLNSRNLLIGDEEICRGTVDQVTLYVREIVLRALDVGASGLILAHNHPSGDAAPSMQDKVFTRDLAAALGTMGICLVDHLIVAASGTTSLRKLGMF
jgi:DNA repair protein RadC